ncbi:hypothetical protein HanIR_Chr16g0787911 [Helianthus annuus]|nr:hypothetical protein HanIR_Chr16g0787911 [Helianthus annuus]
MDVTPCASGKKNGEKNVIEYNDMVALFPGHCIMMVVVGEAVDVFVVERPRQVFDHGRSNESSISYLGGGGGGGLKFMIVFKENKMALEFIRREEVWSGTLSSVVFCCGKASMRSSIV